MPRHPLIDRVLAPEAPRALRLACARGAVPIAATALLPALVALAVCDDEEIRGAALATIRGITDDDLLEVVNDPLSEPSVLEHILLSRENPRDTLSVLLAHPALPIEAVGRLAEGASGDAIDLLISNQQLLILTPGIVQRLEGNRSLSVSQRARLADFAEQFHVPAPVEAPPEADPSGATSSAVAPGTAGPGEASSQEEDAPAALAADFVTADELRALLEEVGDHSFLSVELAGLLESSALVDDALANEIAGDEFLVSAWKRLMTMNGVQRLKEALRGDKEVRAILIRDANRIVATAVLKNPRITAQEVEAFAAQRSLSDGILRLISNNRDWMKSYAILHQLVQNPKTPPGISMNYIARLTLKDLQHMARDRNIAEIVRRTARKHIDIRQKPAQTAPGKH